MDLVRILVPAVLFMTAPLIPPILGSVLGAVADRARRARGTSPRRHREDGERLSPGRITTPSTGGNATRDR